MLSDHIAEVLNQHDIDDYADDDGTSGIHCLKCGWKGTYQREANQHLADVLVSELDLTY
jgi:hypothetical protein